MSNKNLIADLTDSERDQARLQPEETILDLPDVKDIPGQENIHVPELREMADTTISSDDEEGVGIFGDDEYTGERLPIGEEQGEDDLIFNDEEDNDDEEEELDITDDADDDTDVTDEEIEVLERAGNMDSEDDENLYLEKLDDTDFDGEKLNESDDFSGDDLDVPGGEDDDADEEIGEEDEENNDYSLGDNK